MSSRPEVCSICGEEVRWGWRPGLTSPAETSGFWMHRDGNADHTPILGRRFTVEDAAEVERQLDLPREREVPCDPPFPLLYRVETYTAREYEQQRYMRNKKYRERQEAEAAETEEEEEGHDEIEPIEVHCTPMPLKGVLSVAGREVPVPGGVRTLVNLAAKVGWEVERLTYSRGPWLGANGKSLGVSDAVVLRVRGPVVDGHPIRGVACWRDAKAQWAWIIHDRTITRAGVKTLNAQMKEAPSG